MSGQHQFDVFLSHNSVDKDAVELLARRLGEEGRAGARRAGLSG